jgi:hypothetical protein
VIKAFPLTLIKRKGREGEKKLSRAHFFAPSRVSMRAWKTGNILRNETSQSLRAFNEHRSAAVPLINANQIN